MYVEAIVRCVKCGRVTRRSMLRMNGVMREMAERLEAAEAERDVVKAERDRLRRRAWRYEREALSWRLAFAVVLLAAVVLVERVVWV